MRGVGDLRIELNAFGHEYFEHLTDEAVQIALCLDHFFDT